MMDDRYTLSSQGKALLEPEVLLEKLGSMSVHDIRLFCVENMVKGKVNCTRSCVIANLFKQMTDLYTIMISQVEITWVRSGPPYTVTHKTPETLNEFVYQFDAEQFPELLG